MAALAAIPLLERDASLPPEPDVSHLITEDDEPLDILSEKQQRLLTQPLYASWSGPPPEQSGAPPDVEPPPPRPFVALANVGFFSRPENPALVPDVMLSADTQIDEDLSKKENHSYFLWKHGKPPDIVIEIVSNTEGGELAGRFQRYRRARVPYYVVYDPLHFLGKTTLHVFQMLGDLYQRTDVARFESLGLALIEWRGTFEKHTDTWLRWCTLDGKLIPTGAERADDEQRRANDEQRRADDEQRRADDAERRAAAAEERARRLEELLRAKGVPPPD